jgi:hypothetical protein
MTVSDLLAGLSREGWVAENAGSEHPTTTDIARLAYHFYEMRGRQNGHDLEDWLLAEQELTEHYWLVADHT